MARKQQHTLLTLLHFPTRTNDQIYRWTNQKYWKSPNCKLCDKTENITQIFEIIKSYLHSVTDFRVAFDDDDDDDDDDDV